MHFHAYFLILFLMMILQTAFCLTYVHKIDKHVSELEQKLEQYERVHQQDISLIFNGITLD